MPAISTYSATRSNSDLAGCRHTNVPVLLVITGLAVGPFALCPRTSALLLIMIHSEIKTLIIFRVHLLKL